MSMSPRLLRPRAGGFKYQSLRQGLVAYWPLNETAASGDVTAIDESGKGNNLTSNNSVLSIAGLTGNARSLVAANSEFLSSATNSDLRWSDSDFTWAWWFLIPGGSSFAGAHIITSDANSPRDSQFAFSTGSRPFAYLRYTDNTEQGPLTFGTTGAAPNDAWHFCAFRKSGTALSLRFNASVTSATASAGKTLGCPGTPAGFRLGARFDSPVYFNGYLDEVAKWGRALSDAELDQLYNNGGGINLGLRVGQSALPQVANADAQDWVNRVYQQGGSVSSATASAVNTFCESIASAGIRSKMLRLNLFCGTGLNACLTPLYRAASLGDTQLGNATDTNVGGLFVTANYNETGASGGLTGNGSNKYLNTGFPTNTLSASDRHLAAYPITWPNGGYQYFLGSESAAGASQQQFALGHFDYADKGSFAFGPSAGAGYLSNTTAISSGGMWIGVNTSGSGTIYRNGVADGTRTLAAATPTAAEIYAFAVNRNGSGANYFNGRIGGYSIGLAMTAPQAAAYYTAMQSFQTALTRNV